MAENTLHIERARRRLSQREAAAAVGLPFWRYYHIERGWKEPTRAEVTQMAAALGTSADVLFPSGHEPDVVREFGEFLEALDDAADIEKEGRDAIAAIAAEIERRRAVQRR